MVKKIDIAGIQLDNYSARESIMAVERMLSEVAFHTMEEVNMDMLMLAATNEKVKAALNHLDISIIMDQGIIDAAGERSIIKRGLDREDCFYEIIKRFERNHKTVFILAAKEKELQEITEYIASEFSRLTIAGSIATEDCHGEADAIVNEINAATADVILSVLPSPMQEEFLEDNKDKISAILWYGVGDCKFVKKRDSIWKKIQRRIRIRSLENHINRYEEQGVKE